MERTLGEDAAKIGGFWQTDSSQHAQKQQVNGGDPLEPTVCIPPRELYLFSGVERRASIADFRMALCEKEGVGMNPLTSTSTWAAPRSTFWTSRIRRTTSPTSSQANST